MKTNQPDEIVQLGPVTIARFGRVLYMKSNLDEKTHKEYMEQWKNARPQLKKDINEAIDRLADLVKTHDPLILLKSIALSNLFADPETYREITHEGSEARVELLMSASTAFTYPQTPITPSSEVLQEVSELLTKTLNDVFWYFGTDIATKGDQGVESEIRQMLIGRALGIRGEAYWQHIKEMFLEVYSQHNEFLSKEFGFTGGQFLDTLEHAEQCVNQQKQNMFSQIEEPYSKAKQAHEIFKRWAKGKEHEFSNIQDMMEAFLSENPDVDRDMAEFRQALETTASMNIFKVTPRNETDTSVLESISCSFGDNRDFFEKLPEWKGWPLNPSLIFERPVIYHNGEFYLFHIPLALRAAGYLLERLIEGRSPRYYELQFLQARDEYLEKKSLQLLEKLLPGANTYGNLYYPIVADGQESWVETDGLLLFGDTIFILEAKAGKLTARARRGSILRLKHNLEEIIGKAYEQSLRTLNYIKSKSEVQLFDEKHNPVISIKAAGISDFFLINISFEQLTFLAAHLASMKKLGIIKGREWPWTVSLNDLRAISEILEHPVEFIHYLKCRIKANEIEQLQFFDELDIFMVYLKEGLYLDSKKVKEFTQVTTLGYTEDLDSYFMFKEGLRSEIPKPKQQMPPNFEKLITMLEENRPPGFVRAALLMLDCDDESRKKIDGHLERIEEECLADKKSHSFSWELKDRALLIACVPAHIEDIIQEWGSRYIRDHHISNVIAISYTPKLTDGDIRVKVFQTT